MDQLPKIAELIYSEDDFGRSVSTTLSAVIGITCYLSTNDWVIAAFSAVIPFPIIRLVASKLHAKYAIRAQRNTARESADYTFSQLSQDEKTVANAFVNAGGCTLTFSQVNSLSLANAVESLTHREMLSTSMTADSMCETFVLDPLVFDAAQRYSQNQHQAECHCRK